MSLGTCRSLPLEKADEGLHVEDAEELHLACLADTGILNQVALERDHHQLNRLTVVVHQSREEVDQPVLLLQEICNPI